jgi:hypothetical protein
LEWRAVSRRLSGTKARGDVLREYRAAGFGPDDFHLRQARIALADALTRAEDQLELESAGRQTRERTQLKALRRELEAELWR